MDRITVSFRVNGVPYTLSVDPRRTLNQILRDDLGLKGTKFACGTGDCGACTVIMNGKTVNSCLTLAFEVDGKEILTIEGLSSGEKLHPIQEAFVEAGAVQCGFCTPGMIMSSKYLLDNSENPSDEEIKKGLDGNLCRCTGYYKIIEAVKLASQKMKGESHDSSKV